MNVVTKSGFDYEFFGYCQYGLLNEFNEEHDCGQPAIAKVWWHPAVDRIVFVCEEHLEQIEEDETYERLHSPLEISS